MTSSLEVSLTWLRRVSRIHRSLLKGPRFRTRAILERYRRELTGIHIPRPQYAPGPPVCHRAVGLIYDLHVGEDEEHGLGLVLPTLLDLLGLPPAEIAQGQSLAPLMLGREGWEPRPVIFDEFYADTPTGELEGVIEVVDGRWGASLEINPDPDEEEERRPASLLLYDLWSDPMALWSLHEERPELVQKYTAFLEEQFEAHMALAQYFTPSGEVELTPEQLRTLRTLGYIR